MFALISLISSPANAGHLVASLDFERAGSLADDTPPVVAGLGVRAGYAIGLGILEVIPEGRWMAWDQAGEGYSTAELGGRVMFLEGLEPGAFARVVFPMGEAGEGRAWTAGGVLDLTLFPAVDVGGHLGVLGGRRRLSGVAGVHLTLNF